MTDTRNAIPFSIDISRMIELLASQIYPSPFALLRENVQNAFDAIMLRRHAGQSFEAKIEVSIEPGRIVVSDNGIGMSRQELREHFWRAGSSSKNTDEARAAGVVGTFGIGAMANFGIADRLEVVSESARAPERTRCVAERATLSVTDDCITFTAEPATGSPGSVVTATMQTANTMEVGQAVAYIADFVRFVDLPVLVNGNLLSQTPIDQAVPELASSWHWKGSDIAVGSRIKADILLTGSAQGEVRIDLSAIRFNDQLITGRLILRQGVGALRTFRNRFGLATTSVPSIYQLGGVADFLILKPTAGREALTTDSVAFLNQFAAPIDQLISEHLAKRPEANNSQAFINWTANHKRWDLCGQLRARIEPGDSATLSELVQRSQVKPLLVYGGTDPGIMNHASTDRPVVALARNTQRRNCEQGYLNSFGKVEALTDEPRVLQQLAPAELDMAQSALAFRLAQILNTEYFLSATVGFGTISHGLPVLVTGNNPVDVILDSTASSVSVILQIYKTEYGAFGNLTTDFARNVIFPRISNLVPSATKQGTEAFLKTLRRSQDVFEYERSDLENLTSLWNDYMGGKLTMEQAALKAKSVHRSYQVLDPATTGRVRDIVPDVTDNSSPGTSAEEEVRNLSPLPPIQRTDIATDRKLLTIDDSDPPLKGYRCFLAISKRVRDERGEFFLQPHRTSVVWGGQKVLFIFEHHSGEVGLYYDVQMSAPVTSASGGGAFETSTIVMKNQTFIPIPLEIQGAFMPEIGETKRLEVRCDLLYIDKR